MNTTKVHAQLVVAMQLYFYLLLFLTIEPGPPENLQVTHSDEAPDEFILQWDMPRKPNGAILRYKVVNCQCKY